LNADQGIEEDVESPLFVEKDRVLGAPDLDTSGRHMDTSGRSSLLGRINTSTRQLLSGEIDNSETTPEPMDLDILEPAQDQEIFDQRGPSDGDHSTPRGSLSESVLEMVPSRYSPGADTEYGDARSDCTRSRWKQSRSNGVRASEQQERNPALTLDLPSESLLRHLSILQRSDDVPQRRSSCPKKADLLDQKN
jgi:hypothetical protein